MNTERDYTTEATEQLKERLFRLNTGLNETGIDTVLDIFFDDVPEALGTDYQSFREACTAQDATEIGRIIVAALERSAEEYVKSESGQLDLELLAEEIRTDKDSAQVDRAYDEQRDRELLASAK